MNYNAIAQEKNTQILFYGIAQDQAFSAGVSSTWDERGYTDCTGIPFKLSAPKVLCSTLKEILHQDLTSFDAPLLIVIGDVVKEQSLLNNASRLSCFSKQVLFCSVDTTSWPIDDLLLKKGIFTHTRQVAQPVL